MQFNRYLTYKKSRLSFGVWTWVLKSVLVTASFYYIVSKLFEEQFVFSELIILFSSVEFVLVFFFVTVLMLLNWLLEGKKWQLIAEKYQKTSLMQALQVILTGVSLDAILPFGAGAVGSKVLSLDSDNRQGLIAPIIAAQGIQSFWTVAFGLFGVSRLANMTDILSIYGGANVVFTIIALAIVLIVAVLKFWPKQVGFLLNSVKGLPRKNWLKIIAISFFRYLVFFAQLLFLSLYMASEIPAGVLIACITWMFFAKTIVPKPGHLGALGIRGASVVFFLTLAGYACSKVVLATLVLWFINLAIPSLVGLFFVKNLNLRTLNDG